MLVFILFASWAILVALGCAAAYRNGVNDGYMAHWEPWNPGYQKARRYLEKHGKWKTATNKEILKKMEEERGNIVLPCGCRADKKGKVFFALGGCGKHGNNRSA